MSKICSVCNVENADEAIFCKNCGASLEGASAPEEGQSGWYVHINDEDIGPIAQIDLVSMLQNGDLDQDVYVWKEGMGDWTLLSQSELSPYLSSSAKAEGRKARAAGGGSRAVQSAPSTESKPISIFVFELIEILSVLLQILSLIFFVISGTENPSSIWSMLVIISSLMFFVSLPITNCIYIFYLRNKNLSKGYLALLYIQIILNIYPIVLGLFTFLFGMDVLTRIIVVF